jgi:hypothetical protein
MELRALLLIVHISAGCAGLLIGAAALAARERRRWHVRFGLAYQAVVAVMTTTAVALAATAAVTPWGLAVIAVATEGAAVTGWVVARRRRPGWLPLHISLMAGSYVSFVTAALVVNWSSPLAWVLPTLIGSPLIARAARRSGRRAPGARVLSGSTLTPQR